MLKPIFKRSICSIDSPYISYLATYLINAGLTLVDIPLLRSAILRYTKKGPTVTCSLEVLNAIELGHYILRDP
jgi:hypothetical protein